jgi:hypothetical protein
MSLESSIEATTILNPENTETSLDGQHLLVLLKRRELGSVITAICTGKHFVEADAVKLALVAHPDTPSHIAQTLFPLLYIFDRLKPCQIPTSAQKEPVRQSRTLSRS